jgi:hypothetical protein
MTSPELTHFISRTRQDGECWIWTGPKTSLGYGRIAWQGKSHYVHRLVYAADRKIAVKDVARHGLIRHLCNVPSCVNPAHLAAGTQKANMQDCVRAGRIAHGERRPETHLTEVDVREIRRCAGKRRGDKKHLAVRFGVAQSTISNILSRYSWKHLKD